MSMGLNIQIKFYMLPTTNTNGGDIKDRNCCKADSKSSRAIAASKSIYLDLPDKLTKLITPNSITSNDADNERTSVPSVAESKPIINVNKSSKKIVPQTSKTTATVKEVALATIPVTAEAKSIVRPTLLTNASKIAPISVCERPRSINADSNLSDTLVKAYNSGNKDSIEKLIIHFQSMLRSIDVENATSRIVENSNAPEELVHVNMVDMTRTIKDSAMKLNSNFFQFLSNPLGVDFSVLSKPIAPDPTIQITAKSVKDKSSFQFATQLFNSHAENGQDRLKFAISDSGTIVPEKPAQADNNNSTTSEDSSEKSTVDLTIQDDPDPKSIKERPSQLVPVNEHTTKLSTTDAPTTAPATAPVSTTTDSKVPSATNPTQTTTPDNLDNLDEPHTPPPIPQADLATKSVVSLLLGSSFSVTIKYAAKEGPTDYFCIYQLLEPKDGIVEKPMKALPLAWYSLSCGPGGNVNLHWTVNYSVLWSAEGIQKYVTGDKTKKDFRFNVCGVEPITDARAKNPKIFSVENNIPNLKTDTHAPVAPKSDSPLKVAVTAPTPANPTPVYTDLNQVGVTVKYPLPGNYYAALGMAEMPIVAFPLDYTSTVDRKCPVKFNLTKPAIYCLTFGHYPQGTIMDLSNPSIRAIDITHDLMMNNSLKLSFNGTTFTNDDGSDVVYVDQRSYATSIAN